MRRGRPSSFGWLKIETRPTVDVWELPTGYRLSLDKNAWLEEDNSGFIRPIDAPPPAMRDLKKP